MSNTEKLKELNEAWNATLYKKLSDDEERYIEIMNESEITLEERQFCREFEARMNKRD